MSAISNLSVLTAPVLPQNSVNFSLSHGGQNEIFSTLGLDFGAENNITCLWQLSLFQTEVYTSYGG